MEKGVPRRDRNNYLKRPASAQAAAAAQAQAQADKAQQAAAAARKARQAPRLQPARGMMCDYLINLMTTFIDNSTSLLAPPACLPCGAPRAARTARALAYTITY
jgi:hypothetical protein